MSMSFDEVWRFFRGLKGRRLSTLDQQRPFTLVDVSPTNLTVRVESTGFPRTIRRADFEEAWERLREQGRLARTEIHREISPFNPAYVSTLLAQVPGVRHTISPILLIMGASRETPPPRDLPPQEKPQEARPGAQAPEEDEVPGAEEIEESVADRLAKYGRQIGFQVQKEWRTDIGNRIDLVWAQRVPPHFPGFADGALLPVMGFEIETSWRTRKHIKGDIFNLQDLSASLGVIVLCTGPNDSPGEIQSLRAAAERYIKKLGLRIHVWSDAEVDRLCAAVEGPE
jgi:hypothetical protein